MSDTRAIDAILVGDRVRKDLGDIGSLAESIKGRGLLHPVVICGDNRLVAGARRLAACKRLGWVEVPVRVITGMDDAIDLLQAERDENICRQPFCPQEYVEMGRRLEVLLIPPAQEAKAEGRRKGSKSRAAKAAKTESPGGGISPKVLRQPRTADKVAAAVGVDRKTYEKAKAVVAAAEKEPEKYAEVLQKMNESGKVDPAYRKVQKMSKPEPPTVLDTPEAAPEESHLAAARESARALEDIVGQIEAAQKVVRKRVKSPLGNHLKADAINHELGRAKRLLEEAIPYAVCPACKVPGRVECRACHGTGWVSRSAYLILQPRGS